MGTGINANPTNPRRLFPHPNPKASYMDNPNSGTNAPKIDLKTVFAAMADAAWMVKASTRYVWMVIMAVRLPMPMKDVAMIGTEAGVVLRRCRVRAWPMPREEGVTRIQAMVVDLIDV